MYQNEKEKKPGSSLNSFVFLNLNFKPNVNYDLWLIEVYYFFRNFFKKKILITDHYT